MSECCGHVFCEVHLDELRNASGRHSNVCPTCAKPLITYRNSAISREILKLKIHCLNRIDGCKWTGELSSINDHLNRDSRGCEIMCSTCKQLIHHTAMARHTMECPPSYCNCGIGSEVAGAQHKKKCRKYSIPCPNKCGLNIPQCDLSVHRVVCPLEIIRCKLCEVDMYVARKDKKQHDFDYAFIHLQRTYAEIKMLQGAQKDHVKQGNVYVDHEQDIIIEDDIIEDDTIEHDIIEHDIIEHDVLEHGVLEHGVLEHGVIPNEDINEIAKGNGVKEKVGVNLMKSVYLQRSRVRLHLALFFIFFIVVVFPSFLAVVIIIYHNNRQNNLLFNFVKIPIFFVIDVVGYAVIKQLGTKYKLTGHKLEQFILFYTIVSGTIMIGSVLGGVIRFVIMFLGYLLGEHVGNLVAEKGYNNKELYCTICRLVGVALGSSVAIVLVIGVFGMPWGVFQILLV